MNSDGESFSLDESTMDIVHGLYRSDDRTAAVIGCALLEDALIEALNQRIVEGAPKVPSRSPLSRLTTLAAQFGVIGANMVSDLNSHSRVRNTLTHSSDPDMGFSHPDVRDEVHALELVPNFVGILAEHGLVDGQDLVDQLPINTFKGRWLSGVLILLTWIKMSISQISRIEQVPVSGLSVTFPERAITGRGPAKQKNG